MERTVFQLTSLSGPHFSQLQIACGSKFESTFVFSANKAYLACSILNTHCKLKQVRWAQFGGLVAELQGSKELVDILRTLESIKVRVREQLFKELKESVSDLALFKEKLAPCVAETRLLGRKSALEEEGWT